MSQIYEQGYQTSPNKLLQNYQFSNLPNKNNDFFKNAVAVIVRPGSRHTLARVTDIV